MTVSAIRFHRLSSTSSNSLRLDSFATRLQQKFAVTAVVTGRLVRASCWGGVGGGGESGPSRLHTAIDRAPAGHLVCVAVVAGLVEVIKRRVNNAPKNRKSKTFRRGPALLISGFVCWRFLSILMSRVPVKLAINMLEKIRQKRAGHQESPPPPLECLNILEISAAGYMSAYVAQSGSPTPSVRLCCLPLGDEPESRVPLLSCLKTCVCVRQNSKPTGRHG